MQVELRLKLKLTSALFGGMSESDQEEYLTLHSCDREEEVMKEQMMQLATREGKV